MASVAQTWLGRLTARARRRFGAIGPPWRLSVVATRYLERCRAKSRSARMSRAMRLRRPGQPKHLRQARTAIGLTTAHKLLPDALAQAHVLQLARSGLSRRFFQS